MIDETQERELKDAYYASLLHKYSNNVEPVSDSVHTHYRACLSLHHDLHTFLSKLDPDLCYYSGIRYKSELDDCGVSVDGHTKGNGWKVRISWNNETTVLWSPNLKALLNGALNFLKEKVTLSTHA